jgi:hypothetical protein
MRPILWATAKTGSGLHNWWWVPVARGIAMPVRWLQSPALLMAAYVGLFLYAGPFGPVDSAHRDWLPALVVICLVWLACRGSRTARVLLIAYSILGILTMLFGSTSSWWPDAAAVRLGPFACYLAQICLLVSTPMYERTRPGRSPASLPATQFLPAPRLWMLPASVAAGVIITLLPFADLRALACPPRPSAADGACLAQGTGYPIAYRFDGGIVTLHAGNVQWLNVAAPRGLQVIALAADWAMWTLAVSLVLYLVWLNMHREYGSYRPGPVAPSPAPASP